MEEHAALSSMVCWLSECCVAEHPIMISELNKFEDGFVDGEVSVMLDLQGLLHDKSFRIFWMVCSALQEAYRNISEASLAKSVGKATVMVDATTLEQQQ